MAPVDLPAVLLDALKQHRSRQNEEKLQASHRRRTADKEGMDFPSLSAVRATDQGNFDIWAPVEQPVTEMAEAAM